MLLARTWRSISAGMPPSPPRAPGAGAPGRLRSEAWMLVFTHPGHRTDTPTDEPVIWSSWNSASLMATTANLDAPEGAMQGADTFPARDAVFPTWAGWTGREQGRGGGCQAVENS